jgi:uncharacterized protein (DUF1330 family)
MPKGYFIAEVQVQNPDGYNEYRSQVMATVEAYGGRFLVRGGETALVEGGPQPARIVVLEFDSPERAMEWYNSPEYQRILPIRLANTTGRALCSAGVA